MMKKYLLYVTLLLSLCLIPFFLHLNAKGSKPGNDECLSCHSDKDITKTVKGKPVSLYVNHAQLTGSVHSKMLCVDCHKDFNPEEMPHKLNIQPPECQTCHKDAPQKHTFHPQMSYYNPGANKDLLNCKKCHGTHGVTKPKAMLALPGNTNATEFCGNCHKEQKKQHIESEHYKAYLKNNPSAPTCNYCHSKPITKYWIKDEIELKEKQLQLCLSCHNKQGSNEGKLKKIDYSNSNHGKAHSKGFKEAASCVDCHGIHNIIKSDSSNSIINKFNVPKLCGKCHLSITQEFLTTSHGIGLSKGNKDAPACLSCHDEHFAKKLDNINKTDLTKNSLDYDVLVKNKMINCAICHSNDDLQKRNNLKTINDAHSFLPSRELYMKELKCVKCHSANFSNLMPHNILPKSKMLKNCIECHKNDTWMLTRLAKFQKMKAKNEMGSIKGTILGDAGLSRSTFNLLFDSVALLILGGVILILLIHSLLRLYFTKKGRVK